MLGVVLKMAKLSKWPIKMFIINSDYLSTRQGAARCALGTRSYCPGEILFRWCSLAFKVWSSCHRMVIEVNWGLTEIKSNGNISAKHNLNLRIGVRQEKAKMCGDEGRFDFFQEKQNSQILYAIHTHGSRKNRYFPGRLAVRGGGSAPLALTVHKYENFYPLKRA